MSKLTQSHQTAVFVRVHPNDSSAYQNRAEGLVGSLNRSPNYSEGGTIKADIYSVNDVTGDITSGLSFPGKTPVLSDAVRAEVEAAGFSLVAVPKAFSNAGRQSSPRLRRLAEDAGYRLSVVVEPNTKERS